MRHLAILLALASPLALPTNALAQEAQTLTVNGEGSIAAVPDQAVLRVGVEARNESAARAMNEASDHMDALLAVLAERGIEPRDMQTAALSLNQMNGNDSGSLRGGDRDYVARNTLSVTLRDVDAAGEVLQALLEAGANDFSGLSFGLQDPRPVEDEARRAAVADARAKAELYAEAAGVELGPIRSITEGGMSGPMPMSAPMMFEARGKMPVAAGETMVQSNVQVIWSIVSE
ncbi:SIMPL domain-containing protein [Ponticoccus gilvus]|nr:SIMPL domain-containing protein [Enemella evansiae]